MQCQYVRAVTEMVMSAQHVVLPPGQLTWVAVAIHDALPTCLTAAGACPEPLTPSIQHAAGLLLLLEHVLRRLCVVAGV
jgi:hypothetical protein